MSIITPKIKLNLGNLPINPGCYLFRNQRGRIIYIGKAKNLKKRISSYWQRNLDYKTKELLSEIADFDFIITDTEIEALLLEAKLIKENQPKYNLELKGGVRYAYIQITNDDFPRLETVRTFSRQDKIFGPFAVTETRRNLISLANELFKLRTSKERVIKVGEKYRIRCSVPPWLRLVSFNEYQADIKKAEMLLAGKMNFLIKDLRIEMRQYSDQQDFELAKVRRDQIKALDQLAEKQRIELRKAYDQDIINVLFTPNKFIVQLFNITKGVVSGRKEFKFPLVKVSLELPIALADFICQYYYRNEIPQEIVIPQKIQNQVQVEKYLALLADRKTKIVVPQKGDKLALLDLVKKNIYSSLKSGDSALIELQSELSLPTLPSVIECFDVSNLGASDIVGSMVHFKDGRPDKNYYRRFKIKHQKDQSDFAAIGEIIFRRYYRLKINNELLPDLILVDGGKPQLTAARLALKRLGLQLPIAALAKKQEELFIVDHSSSIRLSRRSAGLKLVQRIRDEAHRFAISYHRLLRSKIIK